MVYSRILKFRIHLKARRYKIIHQTSNFNEGNRLSSWNSIITSWISYYLCRKWAYAWCSSFMYAYLKWSTGLADIWKCRIGWPMLAQNRRQRQRFQQLKRPYHVKIRRDSMSAITDIARAENYLSFGEDEAFFTLMACTPHISLHRPAMNMPRVESSPITSKPLGRQFDYREECDYNYLVIILTWQPLNVSDWRRRLL